jgi:hypothetical protein
MLKNPGTESKLKVFSDNASYPKWPKSSLGCLLPCSGTEQRVIFSLEDSTKGIIKSHVGKLTSHETNVVGCYSLPTLDKTMSDRIALLRLILENFLPTLSNSE